MILLIPIGHWHILQMIKFPKRVISHWLFHAIHHFKSFHQRWLLDYFLTHLLGNVACLLICTLFLLVVCDLLFWWPSVHRDAWGLSLGFGKFIVFESVNGRFLFAFRLWSFLESFIDLFLTFCSCVFGSLFLESFFEVGFSAHDKCAFRLELVFLFDELMEFSFGSFSWGLLFWFVILRAFLSWVGSFLVRL